jgi:plastocyanin
MLIGSVGPGFTIVLNDSSGHLLTTVKAGRYSVRVADRSAFLNFHLFGPGVNEATSIAGTGTSQWSVVLKPGTYEYQCDAHASLVHGSFRVT